MKKYSINKDFFKKIDSEEKAYWLGFLYADGCVDKNYRGFRFELNKKDENHLRKLLVSIGSNQPLAYKKDKYVVLQISCSEIAHDLYNLGCTPKKSLVIKFPSDEQVPQYLIKHFIRGYFDGDGCIVRYKTSKLNKNGTIYHRFAYELKFLGTFDMMNGVMNYFGIPNKITSETKIYKLRYQHKAKIKYVLECMYKDATIFLDRKYNLYNEYNDNL